MPAMMNNNYGGGVGGGDGNDQQQQQEEDDFLSQFEPIPLNPNNSNFSNGGNGEINAGMGGGYADGNQLPDMNNAIGGGGLNLLSSNDLPQASYLTHLPLEEQQRLLVQLQEQQKLLQQQLNQEAAQEQQSSRRWVVATFRCRTFTLRRWRPAALTAAGGLWLRRRWRRHRRGQLRRCSRHSSRCSSKCRTK